MNVAAKLAAEYLEKNKRMDDQMASSALVRPGDIVDVIDSRDLLDQVVTKSVINVQDKVDARTRKAWVSAERKKALGVYIAKAKDAYSRIWDTCGKSSVGHNFRNQDVGGMTLNQCDDCRYSFPTLKKNADFAHGGADYRAQERLTEGMNYDMIKALAERMIEVDTEAGIFAWPTEEDYLVQTDSKSRKKGFFRWAG
jgi:dsDNA-binding SOS-regulon protein